MNRFGETDEVNAVLEADVRLGEQTSLTFREIGGGGDLAERDVKLSCAELSLSSFGVRTREAIGVSLKVRDHGGKFSRNPFVHRIPSGTTVEDAVTGLAAKLREELAKDGGRKLIRNFPMHMYAFDDGRIGIRTNRFTRFGTSSEEAITLMGYSKSQWVETEVTEDYTSESVITVYALKQTSFKGRAKLASAEKLRGDCAFYIFLDESEDVRNLSTSWPVDVPIATRESMSLSLAEGLAGMSMWGSLEALRRDEGLMKLEHGSFSRLYAGGVMPSLDLDVVHDVEGAPMLRARREGGGASSPILLLDLFFPPKNIYGLKETIAVVKETRVPLRFDPTTYVRAPVCLFMREGTERLLLTGRGVCLDPIMVMSQGGRITKSWKNKINFLGAGSKLTFWVDFLPGSERPRGLVNVRARYSGILEITTAA